MTQRLGEPADEGSGTIWVLCVLAVVGAVAFAFTSAGAVSARHARAVAAADLAALRAADVLQHFGTAGDACAAATTMASLNGAELLSCSVSGMDVEVAVVTVPPGVRGGQARADARAGPARSDVKR